ncbi:hypothetical protein DRE_02905 [Drechslerella stenobrocha 248]|uniref:Wax synthase domain-containing protein n=1 Tax=Drechslerella stenobrocha 248 TaxID=1043628 RepID=W7IF54_9PEZI|nr:hypothetical protein DRE_02905 [Drechslerella stenobrocha 248]
MLFATPLVPNNVQHFPRSPTYDHHGLALEDRQTFFLVPLSIALQIITLAIIGPLPKSSSIRTLLPAAAVPIILGLGIQAVLRCHHLTSPVINFGYGTAAVCLTLQGVDLLLVIPSRYDAPLTDVIKIPACPVDPANPTWRQRFDWASACYRNPRMLLTPFEPSLLRRRRARMAQLSRSQFLRRAAVKLVLLWILVDLLLAYIRWEIWFGSASHAFASPGTVLLNGLRTPLGASAIWMSVDGLHTLAALFMVGFGGDDHREWPNLFGIWTEEWYTIADFWAVAWHGLFRQQFVFLTQTAKSLLPRIFVPFIFSGMLHFAGMYVQSRDGFGTAAFLIVQPVGIIVQQAVIGKDVKWWMKPLVWITTMVWLIATAYHFIKLYASGGMYDIEPIPISFLCWSGLVEGPVWRWDGILQHFKS